MMFRKRFKKCNYLLENCRVSILELEARGQGEVMGQN